jgi:hypothetical protein
MVPLGHHCSVVEDGACIGTVNMLHVGRHHTATPIDVTEPRVGVLSREFLEARRRTA